MKFFIAIYCVTFPILTVLSLITKRKETKGGDVVAASFWLSLLSSMFIAGLRYLIHNYQNL